MNVSDKCIALITQFEGFRSSPYLCPAGVPTIGYGSTRYGNGSKVALSDPPITEPQARDILRETLLGFQNEVDHLVQVDLTQGQYDALVDFAYNCGAANLQKSTLLAKVNANDMVGAASEFSKWCHCNGEVLEGLVRRREAERQLFIS